MSAPTGTPIGSGATTAPRPSPPQIAEPISPSVARYWVGAVVIAAGAIAAVTLVVIVVLNTIRDVDNFARVEMPGTAELSFLRPGHYTIYYEHRSQIDGTVYETPSAVPNGLTVTLRDVSTGAAVAPSLYRGDFTVSAHGRVGVAVFTITIDHPGHYFLEARTAAPNEGRFVLSVGKGFAGRIVAAVLWGVLIGVVGLGIGLPLIITTAVRRGREKRRRRTATPAAGWTGYQGWQGYMAPGPVGSPAHRPPTATPGTGAGRGPWGPPSGPPVG